MKKFLAIFAMLAIPSLAMAQQGLVGDCYDCHTMHNSQDNVTVANMDGDYNPVGNENLLNAGNASDTEELNHLIGNFDVDINRVLTGRGEIGARMERMDLLANRLGDESTSFTAIMSSRVDLDYADAVVKYQQESNIYNASLAVAGQMFVPRWGKGLSLRDPRVKAFVSQVGSMDARWVVHVRPPPVAGPMTPPACPPIRGGRWGPRANWTPSPRRDPGGYPVACSTV